MFIANWEQDDQPYLAIFCSHKMWPKCVGWYLLTAPKSLVLRVCTITARDAHWTGWLCWVLRWWICENYGEISFKPLRVVRIDMWLNYSTGFTLYLKMPDTMRLQTADSGGHLVSGLAPRQSVSGDITNNWHFLWCDAMTHRDSEPTPGTVLINCGIVFLNNFGTKLEIQPI